MLCLYLELPSDRQTEGWDGKPNTGYVDSTILSTDNLEYAMYIEKTYLSTYIIFLKGALHMRHRRWA